MKKENFSEKRSDGENDFSVSKTFLRKQEVITVIGLIILAFIIRIYFLKFQQFIGTDAAEYAILGKNLISGNGYVGLSGQVNIVFPPLYPLLVGVSSVFVKNLELSGRLVSVLFGTLLIIPVYFFSKKIYSQKVAVISSLLVAFYWVLIDYSTVVLTESTYTFLLICGALVGYTALTKQTKALYLLSGIIFGLCYLTRPEGIGYIAVLIFLTLIFNLALSHNQFEIKRLRKTLICCVALLIGFLVISSPYLLFLHDQSGKWTLGGKGAINIIIGERTSDPLTYEKIAYGLTEDGKEIKLGVQIKQGPNIINYIISHPVELAKRYVVNSGKQYLTHIPFIFPPLLILLVGIGLFRRKWTEERLKKEFCMALFVAYPLLTYPLFFVNSRFLVPILPIAIIWAANGINELQSWLTENLDLKKLDCFKQVLLFKNIVVVIIILSLLPMMIIPMSHQDYPVEHKEAGLWMKEHAPQDSVIMSRKPWVAFYAERIGIPLPYANYSQMLYYARCHNVSHVVIDERLISELRPELAFLLDETKAPENDLKLIYKNDSRHRILIYKVLYKSS